MSCCLKPARTAGPDVLWEGEERSRLPATGLRWKRQNVTLGFSFFPGVSGSRK